MPRAILCILDSFGIGGAPDAADYGDEGADTLGHIAANYKISLPNLDALGLGAAAHLSTGKVPLGLSEVPLGGRFGVGREVSKGKDTPSGHWEIAGVPVPFCPVVWLRGWKVEVVSTRPVTGRDGFGFGGPPPRRPVPAPKSAGASVSPRPRRLPSLRVRAA